MIVVQAIFNIFTPTKSTNLSNQNQNKQ